MSHPYEAHRQTKKEHSRVAHIVKAYAKGGAVHGEKALVGKVLSAHKAEHAALDAEGPKSKHRMDRPKRAKGGRVGKHGNARTIVNVISGGHPAAGAVPPMPPAMPVGAPPMGVGPAAAMPPPRPPMAPPPGAGPGMPPPMPMRKSGGRVRRADGGSASAQSTGTKYPNKVPGMTDAEVDRNNARRPPNDDGSSYVTPQRAKGGRVNQGSPVFEEGRRNGTQVSHDTGKNDLKDMNRKRVVTFMAGGRVSRATGGRVESPDGVAKATKLPGGGGGGEARLAKAHRAARKG
jgi:hypothetical protein